MQFYRFNRAQGVWSEEELATVLSMRAKALFVSDDKGLGELGEIAGMEIKIVTTVGNQSLFWVNRKE